MIFYCKACQYVIFGDISHERGQQDKIVTMRIEHICVTIKSFCIPQNIYRVTSIKQQNV